MSRILRTGRRVRRSLARGASPPGTGGPRASQPHLAGRLIWDTATGASIAAGHTRLAPTTATSRSRAIPVPRLLPHTIQLCIHCRHNPAGFWVSRTSDQTVRRPWCLSCCQDLDPACHHIKPFDLQYLR
jgi:hypothetical protein